MNSVQQLIETIGHTPGCVIHPVNGTPALHPPYALPDDAVEFYRRCGGATLFGESDYSLRIVGPQEIVKTNLAILGEEYPDDLTHSWHIIARGATEEALSIDCGIAHRGRCYDSFWDRHGVAGSCAIVALTFSELLTRVLSARGGYWYWLAGAPIHGDAYGAERPSDGSEPA